MSETPTATETSRIDYFRNGACVCHPPTLTQTATETETETETETATASPTVTIDFTISTSTVTSVDFSDFETPMPQGETLKSGSYSHGGNENLNENSKKIEKWKKDARTGRAKEETEAFMLGTGLASDQDLIPICIYVEWRGLIHGPYVWDDSPKFSSDNLPDPIPVIFDYNNSDNKGSTYRSSSTIESQTTHVFEECAKISFSVCENPLDGPEEGTLLKRVKINTNCGWKIPQDIIDQGETISCETYWDPVDFEENECLLMASLLQETGEVRIKKSRLEIKVNQLPEFTERGPDFELAGYYARIGPYHDISPLAYQIGEPMEGFAAKGKFVEKGSDLFKKMDLQLSKGQKYSRWRSENWLNGFVFRKIFNLDGSSAFDNPVFLYKEFTFIQKAWGCEYGYGYKSNPYLSYPWNAYSPPRPRPYGEGFMRSWPDPSQVASQMPSAEGFDENQIFWDDMLGQFQASSYAIPRDGSNCNQTEITKVYRNHQGQIQTESNVNLNCCDVFRSCWCGAYSDKISHLGNIGGIFGNGEAICCQMDSDYLEFRYRGRDKEHVAKNLNNDVGMISWVASKSLPTDGSQVNARTWWWHNSMLKRWYSGDYRVSYPLTREVRSKHILFGNDYRKSHDWKNWSSLAFNPIYSYNRFSIEPITDNPIIFETPTSTH